ncbi:YjgB family protein [Paenibacillus qinlingensis]|uniref:PBP1b-binding outer membrane lipoprotein LpoB n=1 Tax=Paenibacillus qinlingensis TaxID=1837343 RepID=A0ABU1NZJ1_9BACL|nr:YjgB family protein [Paenibacillus qinlingensis]MDR6552719.1 PBP1b-binding outer membrane lipoprotein LpoB [Paenibacillus qinlingensis]
MKKNNKKTTIYTMLLSTMILLTACSSTQEPAASSTPTPSASASSSPSATPTPSSVASPTASPSASPSTTPAPSSTTTTVSKQLKDMLELAKSGKVSGIPFAATTGLTDDVEKSWGKADKTESAGSGLYATYSKKNAVIGFNKGSQIIDIRSNDPQLRTLTLSQIEQALGKPADIKLNGDDTIYIYTASKAFQLKFIIPKSTGKVDHISVFDTVHSVNNMAG